MTKAYRIALWLPALTLLGLFLGCGDSNLGRVHGTITLGGQPLENATITFTPVAGGRPAGAMTDAQGKYELIFTRDTQGAVIGEHMVRISTYREIVSEDGENVEIIPETLPDQYNIASDLKADVKSGTNEFNFDLEPAADKKKVFQPVE